MIPVGFAHPFVLVLLLVPLVLAVWWRGRCSRVALPFDHRPLTAGDLRGTAASILLAVAHVVPLLILATTIIVLSVPQASFTPTTLRRQTYIQLLLDVSGSMGEETPSKYSNACASIEQFTRARESATNVEGDAVGLMLFGIKQLRWVPLTQDLQAIRNALPFADPRRQPPHMTGTMIGAALTYAAEVMDAEADKRADRVLILISDGQSYDIMNGRQYDVAALLRELGVKLFYVHVGASELPVAECIELAQITGGHGFVAQDRAAMLDVMRQIDRMTKAEVRPLTATQIDFFGPFALVLLALSAVHVAFLFGVRWTPW